MSDTVKYMVRVTVELIDLSDNSKAATYSRAHSISAQDLRDAHYDFDELCPQVTHIVQQCTEV